MKCLDRALGDHKLLELCFVIESVLFMVVENAVS
jgi:hypothetical protein